MERTATTSTAGARGPGSSNVKGVMSNFDLFGIMRDAFDGAECSFLVELTHHSHFNSKNRSGREESRV